MSNEIVKYEGMTKAQLEGLPEEQLYEIAHDMLRWCNHTVRSMSERINATLAKCDAMDKMAELYRTARQTSR